MNFAIPKVVLIISLVTGCQAFAGPPSSDTRNHAADPNGYRWLEVSGTGTHLFTTAILHSVEATETGIIQKSTDIVELEGDLHGRILYHPVSVFDFVAGTLVNTGEQVFSGTVLDSEPVLLHDDQFRFESNLITGETVGKVFLENRIAGDRVRCTLNVFGTGLTPAGDAMIGYTGQCRIRD